MEPHEMVSTLEKIARNQIVTPEKPFVLPSYNTVANKVYKIRNLCVLTLNRGINGSF